MTKTQELLEKEINRLEHQNKIDSEQAYCNGFHKGLRIELRIGIIEGQEYVLSTDDLIKIREDIRKQLKTDDLIKEYKDIEYKIKIKHLEKTKLM